jgi:hypothetical protein
MEDITNDENYIEYTPRSEFTWTEWLVSLFFRIIGMYWYDETPERPEYLNDEDYHQYNRISQCMNFINDRSL